MGGIGGMFQDIASPFVQQNSYQATGAQNLANPVDQLNFQQSDEDRQKQMALQQALTQQMNGQGVNLGQQQFQNALNQGIQAQAGAIASQKGINPALASRMAAQTGGNMTAQAAGQSALQNMQQQLMAQQQLAGLTGQMRGMDMTQGMAPAEMQSAYNQQNIQNALGAQGINANIAQANVNALNKTTGGVTNAAGGILSGSQMGFAFGGPVGYDSGGGVSNTPGAFDVPAAGGKSSGGGGGSSGGMGNIQGLMKQFQSLGGGGGGGDSTTTQELYGPAFSRGGRVKYDDGGAVDDDGASAFGVPAGGKGAGGGGGGGGGIGGMMQSIIPMIAAAAHGGYVWGANSGGTKNSPGNDTVQALLSPGEIVIPKSIANSSDPGDKAKEFVEHIKSGGYKKVVQARKKKGSDE